MNGPQAFFFVVVAALIIALILGMFNGLPFLLGQILLCLIIAAILGALLGLLLGWLIWGRWRGLYDELQVRFGDKERDLERVKVDLASRSGELEQANARLGTLETDVKERSDSLAMLETRFGKVKGDLGVANKRRTDLEKELETRTVNINDLTANLSTTQSELDAERKSRATLETQLGARAQEITALTTQVKSLQNKQADPKLGQELKTSRERLAALEVQVSEKDKKIADLNASLINATPSEDIEGLRSQVTRLSAELDDDTKLRQRVSRRYNVQDPDLNLRYMGERLRLRGYVSPEVRNTTIKQASDQVGEANVIDQLTTRGVVASPDWANSALQASAKLAGVLKDATVRSDDGALYLEGVVENQDLKTQAERTLRQQVGDVTITNNLQIVGKDIEPDDLKDIKGIETVLEPIMHSIGIYTFRQIASWTQGDIEQVRESLQQFKTRIERENWVEQARDLHNAKYDDKI